MMKPISSIVLGILSLLLTLSARGQDEPDRPLIVHPGIRFVSPSEAELTWESDGESDPGSNVTVSLWPKSKPAQATTIELRLHGGTLHRVALTDLLPHQTYEYQISITQQGSRRTSATFEFDNGMNYAAPKWKLASNKQPDALNLLIERLHHRGGFAVVSGALVDGWVSALAEQTDMTVIAAQDDQDQLTKARQTFFRQGVYGLRVSAQLTSELPSEFANLVLVTPEEIKQGISWLSPTGSLVCFGEPPSSLGWDWERIDDQLFVMTSSRAGDLARWDHQYGTVANQSFSGETLGGVDDASQLDIRWLGLPGADFGIDRNPRMPAPLAVGGRLFHQGMNRMIALDAFNGAVLWSLELPELRRVNIPRDCANWSADDQFVYAAMADRLWVIDAANGKLERTLLLPEPYTAGEQGFDWGYIANTDNLLLGTAVPRGSQYEEFWSKPSWYDGKDDQATAKVCGRAIVAYDKRYGDVRWTREVDAVVHGTMTIAGDQLLFVEVKNAATRQLKTGRLTNQHIGDDAHIVCVDLQTGRERWTQKAPRFSNGQIVAFGLADDGQFVLQTSSDAQFHFNAYDLATGKPRWNQSANWPEDHHGGHMQHAVLMNGKLYVQPQILDAGTGEILETNTLGKRRGCATPVGTGQTIIFRGGGGPLSMWSLAQGQRSEFNRLRPSCWLSTIPAQGMLFSPEAGGGCSCGGWMECSIGFAPKRQGIDDER
jgi:outer membrane protein assembly factor BamB